VPISQTRGRVSRRKFLGAAAAAAGVGALGEGFGREPGAVEITRIELAVPGLSPALAGLRVAQLTDVHLGRLHRGAERAMELIAGDRPEIVVLTGDICEDPARLGEVEALAREARGSLATFAIAGNWEHWRGVSRAALERAYERAGARLLWNEGATVEAPARGAAAGAGRGRLALLGLDDPLAGEPDLRSAGRSAPADGPSIWLVHAPGWVDTARWELPPPSLVLSGHTHGGQGRLPGLTPFVPPGSGRFVSGLYRDTRAPLYVSRGIGTSIVPARFLCTPELPIFTLRPA
jgi:uncharacterized protein